MHRYLLYVLLLASIAICQEFRRTDDVSPVGRLSGDSGGPWQKGSLDGIRSNNSIQSLNDNVFGGFVGLTKRQTCSSGSKPFYLQLRTLDNHDETNKVI